jgi:hypothetical protein
VKAVPIQPADLFSKDVRSVGAGRASNGLGHPSHAPLHITPRSLLLLQLPHHMMKEDIPADGRYKGENIIVQNIYTI